MSKSAALLRQQRRFSTTKTVAVICLGRLSIVEGSTIGVLGWLPPELGVTPRIRYRVEAPPTHPVNPFLPTYKRIPHSRYLWVA